MAQIPSLNTRRSKFEDSVRIDDGVQVRELLHKRIRDAYLHPQFQTDVMKPLSIEILMDQQVLP